MLGINNNRLIEYEPSTLAPLGLVVGADELEGRRVVVVASGDGSDRECNVGESVGMEVGVTLVPCSFEISNPRKSTPST